VRIRVFGGFAVEHDGEPLEVSGAMQRGLLFRLALDAGSQVGYRALTEDLWPEDAPENARAALQNLVSRLRGQLPVGVLESGPGGYRLAMTREEVDAVRFQDLVAAAAAAPAPEAAALAEDALGLWTGDPWTPGEGYDWFERDLAADRATALRLRGATPGPVPGAPGEATAPAASPIPAALTSFVGRDEELVAVAGQLEHGRLVTILGPGGAGKTRLALESARAHRHPVVVELAPAGPDELWQAILGGIGRELRSVGEATALIPPLDRAVAALAGTDVLLVLDNCEHLIDTAAAAAHGLLAALPRLRVLATSREPLGVPGEGFVPLGPLDPAAAALLFDDRVRAARGRGLETGEQEAATRIRQRLDGLPLALELAAAKARVLSIDEIADGLDDRFALLSGGLRTVLPRHQTLRALIDWSWSLLDAGERRMLTALAVYPAGIAAADAAEVAAAHGGSRAQLDALVDKSLLQRAGGRYRALETIREYGIERLAEEGGLESVRAVQARVLADAVERRDAQLRTAGIGDAIAWFDAEDDNLAAVLRFCVDTGRDRELVQLTGACFWYWIIRDRNDDAMQWGTAAGPVADGVPGWQGVFVRAMFALTTSFAGIDRGQVPEMDGVAMEAFAREAAAYDHDLVQLLPVLMRAFAEAMEGGDADWMIRLRIPDPDAAEVGAWGRSMLWIARAAMAHNLGDVAVLGASSERAVEAAERTGDRWSAALAQQMRAEWLSLDGRFEEALAMTDASSATMATITSARDLLQQQGLGVSLLQRLGRSAEARERAERMLEVAADGGVRSIVLAGAIAVQLAIELGDLAWARAVTAQIDDRMAEWDDIPAQVVAITDVARGSTAALEGDAPRAEALLRSAAEAAVTSHDYPIMASVAVAIASFGAGAGRLEEARAALELATVLRGAPDPRNPSEARVRAILDAATARPARLEEPEERAADRDAAAAALTQILRR
jgi:predicted ATPase